MRERPTREERELRFLEQWRESLLSARLVLVLDFHGVGASEMSLFRHAIRGVGGHTVVVRNLVVRELIAGTELENLAGALRGPTALVVGRHELHAVLCCVHSILSDGLRRGSGLRFRAGWVQGKRLSWDEVESLVRMTVVSPLPQGDGDNLWRGDVRSLCAMQDAVRPLLTIPTIRPECYEEPEFKVQLLTCGENRFAVVKLVRELTGLRLPDAKALVDNVPSAIPVQDVQEAVARFEEAGATLDRPMRDQIQSEWSTHALDQEALMKAAPELHLQPGWRLCAHAYRGSLGGHGAVWGMPPSAPRWEECPPGRRPAGARVFAEGLAGDGTSASWLRASILIREVNEFAADWHGVSWWTHKLVDKPTERDWTWQSYYVERAGPPRGAEPWEERTASPHDDFGPRVVTLPEGDVLVTFFTESELGQTRLLCHVDRYRAGSYKPSSFMFCCATASGGFVF